MVDLLGKTARDYAHESNQGERILKLLARTEFARRDVLVAGDDSGISLVDEGNCEEFEDEFRFKKQPLKRLDSGPEKRIVRNCRPPLGQVCLKHNDRMYLASLPDNDYPFPCIVLQPDYNNITG